MKTRVGPANELWKLIDAGASNKRTTDWLVRYEAEFGPAMVAEVFKLLGTKLRERAKEQEHEAEQSRRIDNYD